LAHREINDVKVEMTVENFVAMMEGKSKPITAAQVATGINVNPWFAPLDSEFQQVFARRAGSQESHSAHKWRK
jgi:hypothetical protein